MAKTAKQCCLCGKKQRNLRAHAKAKHPGQVELVINGAGEGAR